VVHNIEERNLDHLPGRKHTYVSWRSLEERLGAILQKVRTVAMEYTPYNAIPYVSIVDAGMVELVRRQKVKIVSSANLVQRFEAVWSAKQFRENKKVARVCLDTMHKAFGFIGRQVKARRKVTEYDVQQYILREFRKHSFYTDHPPNCSVNANAANPHYEPTEKINTRIVKGDFVLVDLWAKANQQRRRILGYYMDRLCRTYGTGQIHKGFRYRTRSARPDACLCRRGNETE
jgi:Xaa-Pro dipeptidase